MTLAKSFRLSLYLMLGLSSAALGSASDFFLPEIPYITVFSLFLLAAAYFLEGRFTLSLSAANLLGGVLAACLVLWFAFQYVRKDAGLLYEMPFPAGLLPYLAPALMVLMPVKMLRPKHVGDYWTMYALGLMAMALACTMASDLSFAFFMFAWLILFVRSLSLFFLCREFVWNGARDGASDSRWILAGQSARWVVGFGAAAFGVFLLTPRPAGNTWALTMKSLGRIDVGFNPDKPVDLNRTGSLTLSAEKAFDIYAAEADDRPKNDLSPDQRWRGAALANYTEGKWLRGGYSGSATITLRETADLASASAPRASRRNAFPHLSDSQYFIRFAPASRLGGTVLSDPVFYRPREVAPAAIIAEDGFLYFHQFRDGYFEPPLGYQRAPYLQVVKPSARADLGPPFEMTWIPETSLLLKVPSDVASVLRPWALARVDALIAAGAVSGVARREENPPGRIAEKQREPIARALEQWLATAPEYTYTTELARADRRIDPTVDFLLNVKSGHCERYATGLALMLRSIDIPCQMVMGYKGCDFIEDGHYEIRSDMAHAWVEVLIRRPLSGAAGAAKRENPFGRGAEEAAEGPMVYYWLTLDPSPAGGQGGEKQGNAGWFNGFRNRTERFFQDYIVGYNTDLRGRISKSLADRVSRAADEIVDGGWVWLLTGGGGFLIGLAAIRRARYRMSRKGDESTRNRPGVQFHGRLLDVLKRHGFEPRPDQTPREFAAAAGVDLRPKLGELAGLPAEAAELYYRSRYGDSALGEGELADFEGRFGRFEKAIADSFRR